jgi:hypothetical protein
VQQTRAREIGVATDGDGDGGTAGSRGGGRVRSRGSGVGLLTEQVAADADFGLDDSLAAEDDMLSAVDLRTSGYFVSCVLEFRARSTC